MERFGDLVQQGRSPGEGETFRAAAVLAAVNEVVRETLRLSSAEATAITYIHGTVRVHVRHSAAAANIRLHENVLLKSIGEVLARRYPGRPERVTRLVTRVIA